LLAKLAGIGRLQMHGERKGAWYGSGS
jgi:hypothetical protein